MAQKIKLKGIPFGIGGVAQIDGGLIKGEAIITEHVRLGSSMVILSRAFKGLGPVDPVRIEADIKRLHHVVETAKTQSEQKLIKNKQVLRNAANQIAQTLRDKEALKRKTRRINSEIPLTTRER